MKKFMQFTLCILFLPIVPIVFIFINLIWASHFAFEDDPNVSYKEVLEIIFRPYIKLFERTKS